MTRNDSNMMVNFYVWWIHEKYDYSIKDTGGLEEKIPKTPNRSYTYDRPVTSPDALKVMLHETIRNDDF